MWRHTERVPQACTARQPWSHIHVPTEQAHRAQNTWHTAKQGNNVFGKNHSELQAHKLLLANILLFYFYVN